MNAILMLSFYQCDRTSTKDTYKHLLSTNGETLNVKKYSVPIVTQTYLQA
jgi:hypothetical protein